MVCVPAIDTSDNLSAVFATLKTRDNITDVGHRKQYIVDPVTFSILHQIESTFQVEHGAEASPVIMTSSSAISVSSYLITTPKQ